MILQQRTLSLLFTLFSLSLLGCSNGGNGTAAYPTQSLIVTVQSAPGNGLSNVTVVVGDSEGAMRSYGSTDIHGQIRFDNAPINATVTAATTNLFNVVYDANENVTVYLNNMRRVPGTGGSTASGTLVLNVINVFPGVTANLVFINGSLIFSGGSLITQQTFTIDANMVSSDGKLSVYVIGTDAVRNPIAYGAVSNLTFSNSMTANVAVNQPVSNLRYHAINVPVGADLWPSFYQYNSSVPSLPFIPYLVSGSTSTTINMPYIPGPADQYSYALAWMYSSSYQSISFEDPGGTQPQDQVFDFNNALAVPTGLAVAKAATARPVFAWHTLDQNATSAGLSAYVNLANGSLTFFPLSFSSARTSIRFPELPESLAGFRPVNVSGFSVYVFSYTSADNRSIYLTSSTFYTLP